MKVLHVEMSGGLGGVQTLTRDIVFASQNKNEVFFLKGSGLIGDEIQNKGGKIVFSSYLYKEPKKMGDELFEYIIQNSFDVVVFHDAGLPCFFCLRRLKRNKKICTILYEHSDVYNTYRGHGLRTSIRRHTFRYAMRQVDHIVAISQYVKIQGNKLQKNKKTVVVYNGINTTFFSEAKHEKWHSTFELLYVGRITAVKGLDVLIEACSLLKEKMDFHLSIVGDGDTKAAICRRVQVLGLDKRVTMCEPTTDVIRYYSASDFFVHPAVWNEGFGITLVEAMASGVPCIAFNKGAMSEIIQDGKNGFLVPSVSAAQLADSILKANALYHNEEEYKKMRNCARNSSKRFDISNTVRELEALYVRKSDES